MFDYDVVIIGAGSGGLVACKVANGLGKKTALIEKRKLGGSSNRPISLTKRPGFENSD